MATAATTAPAPQTEANPAPKSKTKEKPVVTANPALVAIIANLDDAQEKAQSYYVEMIECIKKENISRPVLVKSIMEARRCEQTTAESQASRILGIAKNEEVFTDLKNGNITLKVARESVVKKQKNPAQKAAEAAAKPQETREKAWDNAVEALVKAAKDNGFEIKFVLKSVEAFLRSAGLK